MAKVNKQQQPAVAASKNQDLVTMLEGWDEPPPAWKPVPGEILTGTVRGYDTYCGQFGECPVAFIEEEAEGHLMSVYLSATVLYNEFKKVRPKVGEKVGIRYLGKVEGGGRGEYQRFKVMVDRPFNVDAFFGVAPTAPVVATNVPDAAQSEGDVPDFD
jgi:hypothetical protein